MSWRLLEARSVALADFGARRLSGSGVAYLATVSRWGTPRLHPVTPILADGHLFVFMEPTSPKGRDLERGSKYALHCTVEDQAGGEGEFRVTGSARRVMERDLRDLAVGHAPYTPDDAHVLFELLVEDALRTVYAADGSPVRERWQDHHAVHRPHREDRP